MSHQQGMQRASEPALQPGARLSDHWVSEYENWPYGGAPPSLRYLARLATTYDHPGAHHVGGRADPDRIAGYRGGDTVSSGTAEESAQFRRWSATTNVDLTHR